MALSSATLLVGTLAALLLRDGHITQVVVEVGERLFFYLSNYLREMPNLNQYDCESYSFDEPVKHMSIISQLHSFIGCPNSAPLVNSFL